LRKESVEQEIKKKEQGLSGGCGALHYLSFAMRAIELWPFFVFLFYTFFLKPLSLPRHSIEGKKHRARNKKRSEGLVVITTALHLHYAQLGLFPFFFV